jgi:hypothetical protein
MAISFFTDTDLRLLAGMAVKDLRKLLMTKSVREALIFRRNLQVSLASYSKTHPAIGHIDMIQGQVIGICKQIEMAARNAFTVTYWRKIKEKYPNMTLIERVSRKTTIRTEWEKLLKSFSY